MRRADNLTMRRRASPRRKSYLADKSDAFRRLEYLETKGELDLLKGDGAAVDVLEQVANEFTEQDLTARAANVRVKLASALYKVGRDDEAREALALALQKRDCRRPHRARRPHPLRHDEERRRQASQGARRGHRIDRRRGGRLAALHRARQARRRRGRTGRSRARSHRRRAGRAEEGRSRRLWRGSSAGGPSIRSGPNMPARSASSIPASRACAIF